MASFLLDLGSASRRHRLAELVGLLALAEPRFRQWVVVPILEDPYFVDLQALDGERSALADLLSAVIEQAPELADALAIERSD